MKLQFDPNQKFQLDAVAAVADLFDGEPVAVPEFAVVHSSAWGELVARTDGTVVGASNRLLVEEPRLLQNLRAIQDRNDIDVENSESSIEGWQVFDPTIGSHRSCPHFSVEMETGTGKTYVYLRTIFELASRYGFQKFIVVVPSVAVREGVLKNIEITADHFRALYNNLPFEHFVYDSDRVNRLRHFAYANSLQVMVINIDAFRKNFTGTEEERKGNVIYKEMNQLSGHAPIEFVQATRPVVIIDEPQSVDSTEKSQEAIKALNPLLTLRYSATHLIHYNLVYRLDPVRAFEMRLVKQIVVANAATEATSNEPFIRVESISHRPSINARIRIHHQGPHGPRERVVSVKQGADLHFVSGERDEYQDGYEVAEINAEPGRAYVRFSNGRTLQQGEETGGFREEVWRAQLRHTIKRHLENELQVGARGIKVLSLFFIDRVGNYREYDEDGTRRKGRLAVAFEQEIASFAKEPRYRALLWLRGPVDRLHDGYFAQDRKGTLKDSSEGRDTEADDRAYELIMKDKERLLSLDEPLRFIFSHSALREGWDNPNVFQICTLNETKSEMKKRQEIGRGLRLPVNQQGVRIFDESVNRLYVTANESYESFARALQTEYERDCGVTFGQVPMRSLTKLTRVVEGRESTVGREGAEAIRKALVNQGILDAEGRIQPAFDPKKKDFKLELPAPLSELADSVIDLLSSFQIERHVSRERDERRNPLRKDILLTPEFEELWNRIRPRTSYRVEFGTETLVERSVSAIMRMGGIAVPRIHIVTGRLSVEKGGVAAEAVGAATEELDLRARPVPDILAYLQNETDLTRSTIERVLSESGRLSEFFNDPQRFLDSVAGILKRELQQLLVDGIKYERLTGPDSVWEMVLFKNEELINYLTAIKVGHSVYEYVPYDSEVERRFAERLDQREDIRLFVKLPRWFEIDTPVGKYNPDWAVVKKNSETVYLVRETKGTKDFLKLRSLEVDKVRCGKRHFDALGVPFEVVTSADEV